MGIALSRSTDNGETWSNVRFVAGGSKSPNWVGNPVAILVHKYKAQPECTSYPGNAGSKQQKCEAGNSLDDGYLYMYNSGRSTASAVCGESANCNCCRVNK